MMDNYETFPNPPIAEALIDIRATLHKEITLETVASFVEEVKDRFPQKEEKFHWEAQLELKPRELPSISGHPVAGTVEGYLFRSSDNTKVVQSRLDGFTFNKLKPYENWNVFSNEARELWNHYIKIVKPKNVTRLALHYINRIEIPLPIKDLKDYILTVPEIAPGIPDTLANFVMRLTIENKELECHAIITETIEPQELKDEHPFVPLIFDIDVYKILALDPMDEEIWNIMMNLRKFKNEIFFKSLTDKTKRLFR